MRELSADGIPVTVMCRVLKLARQPCYCWLDKPVTEAVLDQAHRANALHDAHREDPEFGYRFLADEARSTGADMADRAFPARRTSIGRIIATLIMASEVAVCRS
ncbi:hypothetical protein DSC45_35225 [Streptomyces sp. YIM 130001]|nr:hypothetical protein DSC45_35225 [Streptomyces sp. YIM 130001]